MLYFLLATFIICTSYVASTLKVRRVSFISFLLISIFFSLVFGFREGIIASTDVQNYKDMYNGIDPYNLNWLRIEPGYLIYQWFLRILGVNADQFIVITSFIQIFLIVFLLRFKFNTSFLFVLLFFSTPFFYNFSANTLRQGVAFLVVFYACSYVIGNGWRWWVLACLGAAFHFSVLLCFIFVAFLNWLYKKKKLLMAIVVMSPVLFFVSLKSMVTSILILLPSYSSLERSVEYALAEDTVLVTGRVFYLISYILILVILVNFGKVAKYAETNHNIGEGVFFRLLSLFYFGVLSYPIFSGIGYLLRFSSYGLVMFPLFLYFVLSSFFSKTVTNICCVAYIGIYFFYSKSLFIFV